MHRRLLFALILTASLAAARTAAAQVTPAAGYTPPDDTQAVRVGAVVFYDYTFTNAPKLTDAAGQSFSPNGFNVARTYINVTGNLSHVVAFRITPDVSRESGTGSTLAGSLTFRLKYGYAQFTLDDWTGAWKQTFVRLGIQQTPFIDAEEGVYRYRFQGTVFVERDGGLSSADAGASFHSNLPNNFGDVHVGVFNGEGYSRAETNDQKAFMARGTVRPFARGSLLARGLRVGGGVIADHNVKDAEKSRRLASVWFEHARVNAGFDYIDSTDQALPTSAKTPSGGWSVFVTPIFKQKGNGPELLIRYDHYQPNKDVDQTRKRTIAGFAYWFPHPGGNATAALLLDYERVKFDGFPPTPANATQERIALHGLINF